MAFDKSSFTRKARYVAEALEILEELGCTIEIEKTGKHPKVYVTWKGKSFRWISSTTPSDWRTALNELAALRRALAAVGLSPPKFYVRAAEHSDHTLNRLWFVLHQAETMKDDEEDPA